MQKLDNSLQEKYDDMKESAKDLALMIRTMLDQDGFYLQHPKAAEILSRYLDNLNEKINLVEIGKAHNESI